ncbi:MAG: tRNA (adenine-N1)-methyltransferase [Desulfosalsimonas sp.]
MTQLLPPFVLITDNKKFRRVIETRDLETVNLPSGTVSAHEIRQAGMGGELYVNGKTYYVLPCDGCDHVLTGIRRQTQLVYPKDAGYILLRLDVCAGKAVGEAGTGSGAMTLLLARAVGNQGRVVSYEKNTHLAETIEQNLQTETLLPQVEICFCDIAEGISATGLDAFFLDVRDPSGVLGRVHGALAPGGHLGVLAPTANQMTRLLREIRQHPFLITEICETGLRNYKSNPSRFRPEDRMVAHTGYLLFARALQNKD